MKKMISDLKSRKTFATYSFRWRLVVGFVAIAMIPIIGLTTVSVVLETRNVKTQLFDHLGSISKLLEDEVYYHIDAVHNDMLDVISEKYALSRVQAILTYLQNGVVIDSYKRAVRSRLNLAINQSEDQISEYCFLDLDGNVVVSSNSDNEGKNFSNQSFFETAKSHFVVQFPFTDNDMGENDLAFGLPVRNWDNDLVGVMAAFVKEDSITNIFNTTTGLGKTGKIYLLDDKMNIWPYSETANTSSNLTKNGSHTSILPTSQEIVHSGFYKDYAGHEVLGLSRKLTRLGIWLVVEQDRAEAYQIISSIFQLNMLMSVITLILALIISLWVTSSISKPLIMLAKSASKISEGDLNEVLLINSKDEIGLLAKAFNHMTEQLRDSIHQLEEKVTDRTKDLHYRARQLEICSILSREITSILKIDKLLNQAVDLIQEAFQYYHVQIFLVETDKFLVLKAASKNLYPTVSKIGLDFQCLNSRCVLENRMVLVNDTDSEEEFLRDANLPLTKSEIITPIRMHNRVIGTLDVHYDQNNCFKDNDRIMMQLLADQIAIAITNAQLFEQSQHAAVLEERNRLARDLHDSVTQSVYSQDLIIGSCMERIKRGESIDAQEYFDQISNINHHALREMRLLIHELVPDELEKRGLLRALYNRLENVEKRIGIDARLVANDIIHFNPEIEKNLYLIALEALNNSLRHSQASQITLKIQKINDFIYFEIRDNGKGFCYEPNTEKCGMGLKNMKARAEKIHAQCQIISKIGEGTQIMIIINNEFALIHKILEVE